MIEWPDIDFPPVNLHSLPHQRRWPKGYLVLEAQYTKALKQALFDEENPARKEEIRKLVLEKREEFNRLWNARARG